MREMLCDTLTELALGATFPQHSESLGPILRDVELGALPTQ